ncbi:MAG: dioxygenase [Lysobacteraceae bacterium]|nr:MAG: dioxygenase [Xanthomonadaceae bacterium]
MSENRNPQHLNGPMPVLFVGHGSPMNAIEDNRWSREFAALGGEFAQPTAILAVSAHWYVNGTYITGNEQPETIHDFGGFPQALFEVEYPSPGHVSLARQVRGILEQERASLNSDWGIDHGSWSVLRWMFPKADVPVIQLSIDRRQSLKRHFEIGRSLAELRDENVLILASGNIVHNLRDAFSRKRVGDIETPNWARRFDESVKQAVIDHDSARLLSLATETDDGRQAHPTLDHWLPLIYAAGAGLETDGTRFTSEGFDWGSISMRNVIFQ